MAEKISLDLEFLLSQLALAGKRLSDVGAAEGAAGNVSVCVRGALDVLDIFPQVTEITLPVDAPELAGATIIVTGSGRRLREIIDSPTSNLACIVVNEGGKTGTMFIAKDCPFKRVTSEFNSHLAIHHDQMRARDIQLHTVLHAQPTNLTYLSHIPAYQDENYFNRHLFRWQPETILSIPQGMGMLPFIVNGSDEQMTETVRSMREHPLVVWARHGVVSRADNSVLHALDLIEYAEAAAHYESLNLSTGEKADGLSPEQVRQICAGWGITQNVY
ncbi:MAG: class II aldolase/adducin family protein [Anaerolineales bacterium]|nr:class II aldolase/adducin family protein [Anaerolineales bacterium]